MAKKNFKNGLDNLMSTTGIQKFDLDADEFEFDNDISDEIKEIFLTKITKLKEELKLWRTGTLTLDIFNKGLKENNLHYDSETDKFSLI
jgi:hypothetical protein